MISRRIDLASSFVRDIARGVTDQELASAFERLGVGLLTLLFGHARMVLVGPVVEACVVRNKVDFFLQLSP